VSALKFVKIVSLLLQNVITLLSSTFTDRVCFAMLNATHTLKDNKYKLVRRAAQLYILLADIRGVIAIQSEVFRFHKESYWARYKNGLKFLWRYLVNDMLIEQKVNIVHSHYSLANKALPDGVRHKIVREGMPLFELRHAESLHVLSLCLPENTLFEGDFLLSYQFNSTELFRITFSFIEGRHIGINCGDAILIGGSQGTSNTAHLMRVASKENGEICPSVLSFLALQALASELKLSAIIGISSKLHVSEGVFNHPEIHQSTYDDMWIANGGECERGFFKMPVTPHLKDLALVKSTHRRRAKLRQQNRLAMFEAIRVRISHLLAGRVSPDSPLN